MKTKPTRKRKRLTSPLHNKVADKSIGIRAPKSSLDDIKKVYVSPFLPDVSVTDIMDHLRSLKALRNIMDKIECVKLVKKNASIDKLSFVSFGINVPKRYVSFLTHASVWPAGVTAKEFVDKTVARHNQNIRDLVATRPTKKPTAKPQQKPKNHPTQPINTNQRSQQNTQAVYSQPIQTVFQPPFNTGQSQFMCPSQHTCSIAPNRMQIMYPCQMH